MTQPISKYFPQLTPEQQNQFALLPDCYAYWNERINVVSRKDIDNLMEHHVLHSLSIAQFTNFTPQTKILDVGTGGGFPGIPLAIHFPQVEFMLIDAIGKKIKVVEAVVETLKLKNVQFAHKRVQEVKAPFDFVISRAVTNMQELIKISKHTLSSKQRNALPNGFICLKGGDLTQELKSFKHLMEVVSIATYFEEDFFATKQIVYVPRI